MTRARVGVPNPYLWWDLYPLSSPGSPAFLFAVPPERPTGNSTCPDFVLSSGSPSTPLIRLSSLFLHILGPWVIVPMGTESRFVSVIPNYHPWVLIPLSAVLWIPKVFLHIVSMSAPLLNVPSTVLFQCLLGLAASLPGLFPLLSIKNTTVTMSPTFHLNLPVIHITPRYTLPLMKIFVYPAPAFSSTPSAITPVI